MPLTLGGAPYTDWEALAPLAEQLGVAGGEAPAEPSALLNGALSEEVEGNLYLLVHSRPETAVAKALEQGETPEKAFSEWLKSVQSLLSFYRQRPQQAVVVEAESAARHPEKLMEWLSENRPEFIQGDITRVAGATEPEKKDSLTPLLVVIAAQTVAQHPEALTVLDELEAASVPLGETPFIHPMVDLDDLVESLRHEHHSSKSLMEKLEADHSELKRQLQEENERLLTQLHKTQQELEEAWGQLRVLTEQTGQVDELQTLQTEHENALRNARQESELLLLQLHKTQEELEQKFFELKELQEQAGSASQEGAPDEHQHHALDKTRQENELLLLQLHNVQEELERYYVKSKGLSGEIGSKNRRIKELEQKKEALSKENKKLKKTRRRLKYELHQTNVLLSRSSLKARTLNAVRFPLKVLRKLSPAKRQIPAQLRLVSQSELFDPQWYLEKNPDIQKTNLDPLVHFVLHGGQEGRSPSMWFSSEWYLNKYKDVADAGLNPLVHYLMNGKAEGRQISPGKKLKQNK